MSKKFQSSKAKWHSAIRSLRITRSIHTAFKRHVARLKVYPTLVYQHSDHLFMLGENGEYKILVVRALYEVYIMEKIKNGLMGGAVGVAITALIFLAYGVY